MPRRFRASVVARQYVTYRGEVMTWKLPDGRKQYQVEMNPAFKRLLTKVMRLAKKPGHSLEVTFRKPTEQDRVRRAVEMADIELTFPD